MEQRIGSSSQPLEGAGFDPAFIPGLTSPVSGEAEETKPEEADSTTEEADAALDEVADADADPTADVAADDESAADGSDADDESTAEESEAEVAPEGPVFEASDRRARIVADHQGVRLFLDDQACEFRWDEIGAVETETPRFGKRFTITVHTPDRRWYPIEIEAESRASFTEWEEDLDAVLDAYFDDETPELEEEEPEEEEPEEEESQPDEEKSDEEGPDGEAPKGEVPEREVPEGEVPEGEVPEGEESKEAN